MSERQEKYVAVRFEQTNKAYTFSCGDMPLNTHDRVVVETKRGMEIGEVISQPAEESGLSSDMEIKPVLHVATEEELDAYQRNKAEAKNAKKIAQGEADELGLQMNFITAEYTLDRSKITLTYLADSRVDFRELLKKLASRLRCRIDLRQVGARDKAKMVGGIGVCGRELCCSKFIDEFERISINMAKNQLLALNIAKLSGHCGALMCCLRFEDDAYKELRRGLPKLNARVEYEGDSYHVTAMNVMDRTCKLENREATLYLTLDDLIKKGKFKKANEKEGNAESKDAAE